MSNMADKAAELEVVRQLKIRLQDNGTTLAAKHRTLFALRGLSSAEARDGLETGTDCTFLEPHRF